MITGDPMARLRMATLLHEATGWDIFPELDERAQVSRLWAQDWDSLEDVRHDEDET